MPFKVTVLHQSIEIENKSWLSLVGSLDGTPVGSCWVYDWTRDVPYIGSLCIKPKHRSKGYGSRIIKAAINKCKAAHKLAISLSVSQKNIRAVALYERLGFRPCLSGEGDLIWMSLPLLRRKQSKRSANKGNQYDR